MSDNEFFVVVNVMGGILLFLSFMALEYRDFKRLDDYNLTLFRLLAFLLLSCIPVLNLVVLAIVVLFSFVTWAMNTTLISKK